MSGCGSNRLGGLEVTSKVVSSAATSSTATVAQATDVLVRITVTNISQTTISGVTVRVNVPSGFTYIGTPTSIQNGNSVRSADVVPSTRAGTLTWGAWTLGPGEPGHPSQLVITAELKASGTPASADFTPEVLATGYVNALNAVPLSLTISPAPAVGLQLHASPSTVAAGE
ncbi:MAG: hypothetical protein ACRENV_08680, partial [Candidatus Dormibacteria bacterium]